MEFPGMTMNDSPGGEENLHEQSPIKDLDEFFIQFYHYYHQKGLGVILLSEFCTVLSLGFTVFFTTFLMGVVNWPILSECFDEMTCQAVEEHLFLNPLHQEPSIYRLIITMYFIILFSYWMVTCHRSIQRVRIAWEMEEFYRESLKIPFASISDIPWYEVIDKFLQLYEQDNLPFLLFPSSVPSSSPSPPSLSPTSPLLTHNQDDRNNNNNNNNTTQTSPPHQGPNKPKLTTQHIIWRIMRKENYFIALINKHQLNLFLPWWLTPYTTEQLILTKTLEWSLSFCLFDEMFVRTNDGNYMIPDTFFTDSSGLQFRFQMLGFILFLLIPFLILFMILHFFLENASYFHSTKAYLGPRQWTSLALWQFREFNELKHIFEDRMNVAYIPATEYLLSFRNPYIIVLAKLVSYVSGGIVATILFISVFHSEAIVHITVLEHNLLWYLGISSALFATSRSILPDEAKKIDPPAVLLQKMVASTHQDGAKWAGREQTTVVKNEVGELLVFKIQLFLTEISGVLLTPLILCFSLPACVPTLLEFLREHSQYEESVGTVCDYCLFDIAKHGDPNYGSITEATVPKETLTSHKNPADIRLNGGKLEKSVLNYMQHYPNADLGPAANNFLSKIDTYRSMIKTKRERQISSIFERSLFPGGGQAEVDDRVILPPAHSSSCEEITDGKIQGIAIHQAGDDGAAPHLAFPSNVGNEILPANSYGINSPARPFVTSNYYDSTTAHNISANRGSAIAPPPLYPPVYPSDRRNLDRLPIIHEQVISQESMLGSDGKDGRGNAGRTTGQSTMKSPNYSQFQRSRMLLSSRGPLSRRNPSSSLLGGGRRSGGRLNEGEDGLPSVLLSLLQKQNIDYENDFFWLEKFHRDKIVQKHEFEKSLLEFKQSQSQLQLQSQSQQSSYFPFANPGMTASSSRWPGLHAHSIPSQSRVIHQQYDEQRFPLTTSSSVDNGPGIGMYATNINRNVVSSPKPSHGYRQSTSSDASNNDSLDSVKRAGSPHMILTTTSGGESPHVGGTMTSGGGYFPFDTSTVNSVDENDPSSLEHELHHHLHPSHGSDNLYPHQKRSDQKK